MVLVEYIVTQIFFLLLLYVCIGQVGKCIILIMRGDNTQQNIISVPEIIIENQTIKVMKVKLYENDNDNEMNDTSYSTCAICLEKYEIGESVSVLKPCNHMFHENCIDEWIKKSIICPLCNT